MARGPYCSTCPKPLADLPMLRSCFGQSSCSVQNLPGPETRHRYRLQMNSVTMQHLLSYFAFRVLMLYICTCVYRKNHRYLQSWARGARTLPAVPRSTQPSTLRGMLSEYRLSGWVIIINGDGGCRWQQPTGILTAQFRWLGLRVGSGLALFYNNDLVVMMIVQ